MTRSNPFPTRRDALAGVGAGLAQVGVGDEVPEGQPEGAVRAERDGTEGDALGELPHPREDLDDAAVEEGEPEDDRLWATLEALDLTLAIHVRLTDAAPAASAFTPSASTHTTSTVLSIMVYFSP